MANLRRSMIWSEMLLTSCYIYGSFWREIVRFLSNTLVVLSSALLTLMLVVLCFEIFNAPKPPSYQEYAHISRFRPYSTSSIGKTRVIALGGSTTYGINLDNDATWPSVLQQESFGRFEVVNIARPGNHLDLMKRDLTHITKYIVPRDRWLSLQAGGGDIRLESVGYGWKDLKPDIILIAPIINDTVVDFFFEETSKSARVCGSILGLLNITKFFCSRSEHKSAGILNPHPEKLDGILVNYRRNLKSLLVRIKYTSELENTQIYLVSLPTLFSVADDAQSAVFANKYWKRNELTRLKAEVEYFPVILQREREVMQELAFDTNVGFLDFSDIFSDLSLDARLRLFNDSIHLNQKGSFELGRRVADSLVQPLP